MDKLNFEFKNNVALTDLKKMNQALIIVLGYASYFCNLSNLPCLITSIFDEAIGRQTDTHREGRAFDISVRNWGKEDIEEFIDFMNRRVGYLGAISNSDGKQRVVVYHKVKGNEYHLHAQVNRNPKI